MCLSKHNAHDSTTLLPVRPANWCIWTTWTSIAQPGAAPPASGGGAALQPKKCALAQSEVGYLGHIIGGGLIKPQKDKLEAVRDCPRPQTSAVFQYPYFLEYTQP